MRINITEIYRIETINSVYEIKVIKRDNDVFSVAKKMGKDEESKRVSEVGTDYLDRLVIGVGFLIPGCWEISNVQDYAHYVLANESKRTTVEGFFGAVAEAAIGRAK